MPTLKMYHRSTSLDDALRLLARNEVRTVLIAGGVAVTPRLGDQVDEVVDLQALGLDVISTGAATLLIGAMTTLQTLVEREDAPAVLREAARREAPNTFRHVATIGGLIASGDWESELLAALLVFDAQVVLQTIHETRTVALADLLAEPNRYLVGAIITQVSVATDGQAAAERTARTPADKPIVAVLARRTAQGELRLALAGIAPHPILASPASIEHLTPPGDFRGSSEYRKHLAIVLARRAIGQV